MTQQVPESRWAWRQFVRALRDVIPMPALAGLLVRWYIRIARVGLVTLQILPWFVVSRAAGLTDPTAVRVAITLLALYVVLTALVWARVIRASYTANVWRLVILILIGLNMFVGTFSSVYWNLAGTDPNCFNVQVSGPDTLYFTLTTLTTTGLGDIQPQTRICRNVASVQMITGGIIVAWVTGVAISGSNRRALTQASMLS